MLAKKTQEEAANLLGIKVLRTYQKYEGGERMPPPALIRMIALQFGVTTDFLFGLSDDPRKSKAHKPGTDVDSVMGNH